MNNEVSETALCSNMEMQICANDKNAFVLRLNLFSINVLRRFNLGSKFFVLLSLYVAQTIPGHFSSNAVPVIMRKTGTSLELIGYMTLTGLPWILKFLWAPFVDKICNNAASHRLFIFLMQVLFASVTFAVAWMDLTINFTAIVVLMTLSYLLSSTQDVAVDSFSVKILKSEERGFGNGIQTGGNMLGFALGVSVALILYFATSWNVTLIIIAVTVFVLGLPILFYGRREEYVKPAKCAGVGDIFSYFRTPGTVRFVLIMLFTLGPLSGAMVMFKPLLVDMGYDYLDIAMIGGLYPLVAGLPASMIAGYLIAKYGTCRVYVLGSFLSVMSYFFLVPATLGIGGKTAIHLGMAFLTGTFAVLMTVVNKTAMDYARKGREGSDFTIAVSAAFTGSMIFAGSSGLIASTFGYTVFFIASGVSSVLILLLFQLLYIKKREIA